MSIVLKMEGNLLHTTNIFTSSIGQEFNYLPFLFLNFFFKVSYAWNNLIDIMIIL